MSETRRYVAAWKLTVAVLAGAIALLYLWALSEWPRLANPGTLGAGWTVAGNRELAIARLQPESPLATAGAKVGDRVLLDHPRDARRYLGAGETVGLTLISQGSARRVEVVARPAPPTFFTGGIGAVITAGVSALALAIALLVGLRRADQASLRFLVLAVLMQPLNYVNLRLPSGALADFLFTVSPLVPYAVVYFCFLAFCLTFPDGETGPLRSRMRRLLLIPGGLVAAGLGAWGIAEIAHGTSASIAPAPFAIAFVALSLATLAVAWRESRGALRSRIGWIAVSMGLVYLSYLWSNVMLLLGLIDWVQAHQWLPAGAIAVGYCGLAYALLRHRIFDVGFAVNRALVYASVSAVMLLAFGLLEWLAHKLVHFESQQNNTLLDAGIALVVFLAFNKIHHHAEQWVERLLFRAWHEREAALRRFVKRSAHFAAPDALVESLRAALERFTGGASAAVYAHAPDGSYRLLSASGGASAAIPADDPLAVALRAEPVATSLEGELAAGGGALALPMASRGVLNGFILLGPKGSGESYRPDEVEVLGFAARQVGYDLHALEVERLHHELDCSALELAAANAKVEALRSMVVNGAASAE